MPLASFPLHSSAFLPLSGLQCYQHCFCVDLYPPDYTDLFWPPSIPPLSTTISPMKWYKLTRLRFLTVLWVRFFRFFRVDSTPTGLFPLTRGSCRLCYQHCGPTLQPSQPFCYSHVLGLGPFQGVFKFREGVPARTPSVVTMTAGRGTRKKRRRQAVKTRRGQRSTRGVSPRRQSATNPPPYRPAPPPFDLAQTRPVAASSSKSRTSRPLSQLEPPQSTQRGGIETRRVRAPGLLPRVSRRDSS